MNVIIKKEGVISLIIFFKYFNMVEANFEMVREVKVSPYIMYI